MDLLTVHQILMVVVSLLLPATGSPGQQRHDTDAAWSPDGRKLVFMSALATPLGGGCMTQKLPESFSQLSKDLRVAVPWR